MSNPKQKQRSLTRIYFRSLLLTMLGVIALFSLADLSPSFMIIGIVGASIGYWYAVQGPSTISRIAINALLAVVVVLGLLNALRGNFSVSSFAFFSLLLMILKLFDLRSPRDHGQILVLSLGLLIASALTSNNMITGLGVFLLGFIFIRSLMLFRLYALCSRERGADGFETRASIDLRSMQTVTGFVCCIGAVLIFLVMPRSLGNNTLGQWGGPGVQASTTGFDDDVELGRPGRITTSPTPVLRMTIRDRNDQPVGNESSKAIYLRGAVLTEYRSGRWVSQQDQNIPVTFRTRIIEESASIPLVNDNSRADWTHEYAVTFEHSDQNYGYLFTPWKPLELKSNEEQSRVGIDPVTRMILLSSRPISSYRVRSSSPEFEPIPAQVLTRQTVVSLEGVTNQIRSLAYQVLTSAGIDPSPESRPPSMDIQAVRALETHLRTQYAYTLDSEPIPNDQDATEWFLFESKKGHCEYYASALTLMSRSIGVQARVITGYVAAEYNDVTGTYMVRESNAHAWVEAQVGPDFWRTFDGTPQSDFHSIHEPEPTFFRSLAKFYEAIEQAWVVGVVGYDSDSREAVFGDVDPDLGLASYGETLQDRLAAGRMRLVRKALITAGTIFVISMITGIVLIALVRRSFAQAIYGWCSRLMILSAQRRQETQEELAEQRLAASIYSTLHQSGVPCPHGIPIRTHLKAINREELNGLYPVLDRATTFLYNYKFANRSSDSAFIATAREIENELKTAR